MKAKETVMNFSERVQAVWQLKNYDMRGRTVSGGLTDALCKAQAEISFKAGAKEVIKLIESKPISVGGGDSDPVTVIGYAELNKWKVELEIETESTLLSGRK